MNVGPCHKLTRKQSNHLYLQVLHSQEVESLRRLCKEDLFFLLTVAFQRKDIDRDWLYARCRDVEASPDGHLDLWAREHYKSTIITYGQTIRDILNNPDITFGIFSHTRPIAKAFLSQIKTELETNRFLQSLFPDILWKEPKRDAPTWSLDSGIVVKRKTNPKEKTIEAWGLVDGQPTSKHFRVLLYDDVVTKESVNNPEQIKAATDAWALSLNLGAEGGSRRTIGTRYHMNDSYGEMIKRGSVVERLFPGTKDGTETGEPVFLSAKALAEKRRDMGPYIFAAQILQNPSADKAMGFQKDWLRYWYPDVSPASPFWNYYLLCDPAGEKKKENDYTVMQVIGLGPDNNYYLVDGIRDRLNLTERTNQLIRLHRKWRPVKTGYEKYGKDSDIEHIEYIQQTQNYRFAVLPMGGAMAKNDRIRKLVPIYEQGRFFLPNRLLFTDHEGETRDFVQEFVDDEFCFFPVATHDDMLDNQARILHPELNAEFPEIEQEVFGGMPLVANNEYNIYGAQNGRK